MMILLPRWRQIPPCPPPPTRRCRWIRQPPCHLLRPFQAIRPPPSPLPRIFPPIHRFRPVQRSQPAHRCQARRPPLPAVLRFHRPPARRSRLLQIHLPRQNYPPWAPCHPRLTIILCRSFREALKPCRSKLRAICVRPEPSSKLSFEDVFSVKPSRKNLQHLSAALYQPAQQNIFCLAAGPFLAADLRGQ